MVELRRERMGGADGLLIPHACYLALGSTSAVRASAYCELFSEALSDALVEEIRIYLQQQKVLGTDRFRAWVTARTGKFSEVRPIERPARRQNCP